jgi:hypothetical protein
VGKSSSFAFFLSVAIDYSPKIGCRLSSAYDDALRSNRFHQLHALPSQLSYNTLTIPYTNGTQTSDVILGRREIFDIRAQLMAEDDEGNDELISGLETGDIEPYFYEGGFKTWECALDLAKLTATDEAVALGLTGTNDSSQDEEAVHVIEVSGPW